MNHNDCLFCKIIQGEIPCEKIFENEHVLVFKDIYPQAKIHYLMIHKKHTKDFKEMLSHSNEVTELFESLNQLLKERSELDSFRLVTNIGASSGQSVFHTHFHILSGEQLKGFGA